MKANIEKVLREIDQGTDALERDIEKLVTRYEKTYGMRVENIEFEREAWPEDEDFCVHSTIMVGFSRRIV